MFSGRIQVSARASMSICDWGAKIEIKSALLKADWQFHRSTETDVQGLLVSGGS